MKYGIGVLCNTYLSPVYKIWAWNPQGKGNLQEVRLHETIILKWELWTGFIWLSIGTRGGLMWKGRVPENWANFLITHHTVSLSNRALPHGVNSNVLRLVSLKWLASRSLITLVGKGMMVSVERFGGAVAPFWKYLKFWILVSTGCIHHIKMPFPRRKQNKERWKEKSTDEECNWGRVNVGNTEH